jgi:hypothetical protein
MLAVIIQPIKLNATLANMSVVMFFVAQFNTFPIGEVQKWQEKQQKAKTL